MKGNGKERKENERSILHQPIITKYCPGQEVVSQEYWLKIVCRFLYNNGEYVENETDLNSIRQFCAHHVNRIDLSIIIYKMSAKAEMQLIYVRNPNKQKSLIILHGHRSGIWFIQMFIEEDKK